MKYHIIAIEREYASGGREIGRRVAERLGIPCYGREILEMAAKELNTDLRQLEYIEEKATGSVMYSMYMMAGLTNGNGMPGESKLFLTESEIIRKITQTPAVVVGRCAVHSLKDRNDVLRVFIHASSQYREKRAVSVYGVPEGRVMEVLRKADKRRSNYYKVSTGNNWKDNANYDIILDGGTIGIEKCVDILDTCCR